MNLARIISKAAASILIILAIVLISPESIASTSFCYYQNQGQDIEKERISTNGNLQGYKLYQSDGYLELYLNSLGSVAIKNTVDGTLYTSDPKENIRFNNLYSADIYDEIIVNYAIDGKLYFVGSKNEASQTFISLNSGDLGGVNISNILRLAEGESISFSLNYRLENSRFVAEIIDIKYPKSDKITIASIDFLKGFGCEKRSEGEGFFLLPDGGGGKLSLDKINKEDSLEVSIYSNDKAIYPVYVEESSSIIPFFAKANKTSGGIFALIEEGESIADINAVRSKSDELSSVFPTFNLTSSFEKSIGGKAFKIYAKNRYDKRIKLSYSFFGAEKAEIKDIAALCREELLRSGFLSYTASLGDNCAPITLYLDGEDVKYKKALEILKAAKEEGIGNISAVYKNALNGLDIKNNLGTKKQLTALCDFCNSKNITLYIEYDITKDKIGNEILNILKNELPFKTSETFSKAVDNIFIEDERYLDNLYLPYFGNILYSDFNESDPENREDMKTYTSDFISKLSAEHNIALEGGNAYILKGIDKILNFKREKSLIADGYENVLFNSAVLHGEIDYILPPITVIGKITTQINRALESGVMPSFKVTSENYRSEIKSIAQYYLKYDDIISKIRNKSLVSNTKIEDEFYLSSFEGGYNLYVNYSTQDKTVLGNTVKAGEVFLTN